MLELLPPTKWTIPPSEAASAPACHNPHVSLSVKNCYYVDAIYDQVRDDLERGELDQWKEVVADGGSLVLWNHGVEKSVHFLCSLEYSGSSCLLPRETTD